MPRKTEEASRLMRATAPFRCTYCDKHYNHQSAATSEENPVSEPSSRSNGSPSENYGVIKVPARITSTEARRLLSHFHNSRFARGR